MAAALGTSPAANARRMLKPSTSEEPVRPATPSEPTPKHDDDDGVEEAVAIPTMGTTIECMEEEAVAIHVLFPTVATEEITEVTPDDVAEGVDDVEAGKSDAVLATMLEVSPDLRRTSTIDYI
uniref:Uncharacterized protein n=1 Tax=Anopheles atroparvus TaxID=41427 RepID=A0A182JB90_ANOAO